MRTWIFVLLITFLCGTLRMQAQSMTASDSAVMFTASRLWMQQTYGAGTHLVTNTDAKIGDANLKYTQEEGAFRKSQEAFKEQGIHFNTKGQTILKRWHLSGAFTFQKFWLDSLNNTMQVHNDHFIPYYYFATKHGKYEQQVYGFNSQIFYSLLPDKLWLGTKVGLDYVWTTRSVDPRPDITDFKLNLQPEVIAQFGRHHVGLSYLWGYGDEKTQLRFKNSTFTQSLAYPDRIHYINQGFGFITLKDTTVLYNSKKYSKVGAHYNFILPRFKALLNASYAINEYQYSMNEDRKLTYVKYSFEEQLLHWNALLVYQSNNRFKHTLAVAYADRKGIDWNRNFRANSYRGRQERWDAQYIINWQANSSLTLEAIPSVSQLYEYRKDAAASHQMETTQTLIGFSLGAYLQVKGWVHHLQLGMQAVQPTSVQVAVPSTQENVFTTNIFFPDYYYYANKANIYSLAYQLQGRQIANKMAFRFFAMVNWTTASWNRTLETYHSTTRPTGNRLQCTVGLGINI